MRSQLQGANLSGANLMGATLDYAQLNAAVLDGASLQSAQMQGTLLFGTSIKGAFLKEAQLQGAILSNARLQGVVLQATNLEAADLYCTNLWRAENAGVDLNMAWARNANTDTNDSVAECGGARWSHEDYEKLKDNLRGITTHSPMSLRTLNYIDVLDPSINQDKPGIKSSLSEQLEKMRSKTTQEYVSFLVGILGQTGCNSLKSVLCVDGNDRHIH